MGMHNHCQGYHSSQYVQTTFVPMMIDIVMKTGGIIHKMSKYVYISFQNESQKLASFHNENLKLFTIVSEHKDKNKLNKLNTKQYLYLR